MTINLSTFRDYWNVCSTLVPRAVSNVTNFSPTMIIRWATSPTRCRPLHHVIAFPNDRPAPQWWHPIPPHHRENHLLKVDLLPLHTQSMVITHALDLCQRLARSMAVVAHRLRVDRPGTTVGNSRNEVVFPSHFVPLDEEQKTTCFFHCLAHDCITVVGLVVVWHRMLLCCIKLFRENWSHLLPLNHAEGEWKNIVIESCTHMSLFGIANELERPTSASLIRSLFITIVIGNYSKAHTYILIDGQNDALMRVLGEQRFVVFACTSFGLSRPYKSNVHRLNFEVMTLFVCTGNFSRTMFYGALVRVVMTFGGEIVVATAETDIHWQGSKIGTSRSSGVQLNIASACHHCVAVWTRTTL